MHDLMSKLALSKKIMDKHNEVPRGQAEPPMVNENVNINANYNIPDEIIQQNQMEQPVSSPSLTSTKPVTEEAVLKSKLPDEIKKLMIENPINQPSLNQPTLSNEIIEGAARLMGTQQKQNVIPEQKSDTSDLKQMIRDVVRDTVRDVVKEELKSAGLISESSQKTNETLSLRVGKHIFEGKVLKIKKLGQ